MLVSAKSSAIDDTTTVGTENPNATKIRSDTKKASGAGMAKQSPRGFFIKKILIPLKTHMTRTSI